MRKQLGPAADFEKSVKYQMKYGVADLSAHLRWTYRNAPDTPVFSGYTRLLMQEAFNRLTSVSR